MIAFLDTSIVLRMVLAEPMPLREWTKLKQAFVSRLLPLETRRAFDRYRLLGRIDDEDVAQLHREFLRILRSVDVVALSESILDRAAGPMPTVLGALDAVHLATALEARRRVAPSLVFATHDERLARAAVASGFDVCGV